MPVSKGEAGADNSRTLLELLLWTDVRVGHVAHGRGLVTKALMWGLLCGTPAHCTVSVCKCKTEARLMGLPLQVLLAV